MFRSTKKQPKEPVVRYLLRGGFSLTENMKVMLRQAQSQAEREESQLITSIHCLKAIKAVQGTLRLEVRIPALNQTLLNAHRELNIPEVQEDPQVLISMELKTLLEKIQKDLRSRTHPLHYIGLDNFIEEVLTNPESFAGKLLQELLSEKS